MNEELYADQECSLTGHLIMNWKRNWISSRYNQRRMQPKRAENDLMASCAVMFYQLKSVSSALSI